MRPQKLALTALLILFLGVQGDNVILDLGDVVFQTDSSKAPEASGGWRPFFLFLLFNPTYRPSASIREQLFSFLDAIQERRLGQAESKDEHGKVIPQIMCDWLQGTPSDAIRATIATFLENNPSYFKNGQTQTLLTGMTTMIFTPSLFAQTRLLVPEALDFVLECKAAGHNVYVLTNWDKESLELVKIIYSNFFDLIDGVVSSGDVGDMKPNKKPYLHLLEKYCLKAAESAFWDDRIENVDTGNELDIRSFLVTKRNKKPNFARIRKQCRRWQAERTLVAQGQG